MFLYKDIESCRICGNSQLDLILDLGEMSLTGIFPRSKNQQVPSGPLTLVKCRESNSKIYCGLVQLKESYNPEIMFGGNYGYRSGLNDSMIKHLHCKVNKILQLINLKHDDIIVDIGSNDSTLLQGYPIHQKNLVGFDPTGEKFQNYYPKHIQLVKDFFDSQSFKNKFENKKAKVVTSIAMFYDLEDPLNFAKEVHEILSKDGLWVLELSYLALMLKANSFDTICHEHLEYYRLKQIHWIMEKVGFKIIDIELNKVNGGSFSIIVSKTSSSIKESPDVAILLDDEEKKGLNTNQPYDEFRTKVFKFKSNIRNLLDDIHIKNKLVLGYGASTKGNVLLQFSGITQDDLPYIAEINRDKFGSYTPGTFIPIVSEEEARKMNPDFFLVFPWHFRDSILSREKSNPTQNASFIFPLPSIEIIEAI